LQSFSPLSQYLCTRCGSILKETNEQIEISTVIEDCPKCGAFLASTLEKRNKETELEPKIPRFQTAYDLCRFKIDIAKISKFMPLSTTGTLCIAGYKANLLLTRLCVRALLPTNYGGLGSSHVIIVDAGNKSDFYQTVNFVKQYGLDLKRSLDRIIVSRTFTIYQLKSLLQRELPKVIAKYQPSVVIVPGLLDMFDDDPNIKKKEAKTVIARMLKSINEVSTRRLVITSIQESKYAGLVIPSFGKRITLSNANHNRLNVELYSNERRANVVLSEKELKIIRNKKPNLGELTKIRSLSTR
jgi:DNA-directed RNA polymerase subunit RPC12/RpoP